MNVGQAPTLFIYLRATVKYVHPVRGQTELNPAPNIQYMVTFSVNTICPSFVNKETLKKLIKLVKIMYLFS